MTLALFAVTGLVAVVATGLAVSRANAVHGLLYLIVSLIAVAGAFALLGAPLAAALEVIVYAGAIVVLFVFVVTLLAQTEDEIGRERTLLAPSAWTGPAVLAGVLLVELAAVALVGGGPAEDVRPVAPKAVAVALYGPYVLGVEAASFLLLAGLVGAWHVGRGYRRRAAPAEASPPAESPAEPIREAS